MWLQKRTSPSIKLFYLQRDTVCLSSTKLSTKQLVEKKTSPADCGAINRKIHNAQGESFKSANKVWTTKQPRAPVYSCNSGDFNHITWFSPATGVHPVVMEMLRKRFPTANWYRAWERLPLGLRELIKTLQKSWIHDFIFYFWGTTECFHHSPFE